VPEVVQAGGLLGVAGDGRAGVRLELREQWKRQAWRTTGAGILARGVSVAVRLITIPLALRLLGADRYGLWLSVGSFLAWLGFIGPGLGYGLVNAISAAKGTDDRLALRRHVSTAVVTMFAGSALLLLAVPLLASTALVPSLLGVGDRHDLIEETRLLVAVIGVLFAGSFFAELANPLCAGLQEGYLAAAATMAANLAMLAGVVVLSANGGTLLHFALVVGVPPILANLSLLAYQLYWRHPDLKPSFTLINRESIRSLLGFGGWMLVTQIGDLAIFQSANILIANHFGPGEVPRYAVPAAVFMNVANLCFLIIQPLWPALKEAAVRGDWEFINSTISRTLRVRLAIMFTVACLVVVAGPPGIRIWVGDAAVPTRMLLIAMGGYYLLVTLSGHYVVLLLSFGLVRLMGLLTGVVGIVHIAGFLLLWKELGLIAIPVSGALGIAIDCFVVSRAVRRYIRAHGHA